MFSQLGMDHRQLIAWTLANVPLLQPPGTKFAYSNFGYCVLGRVIERKTGQSYADTLSHSVLRPVQVEGMRIAGNTLQQRLDDEVVYYRQQGEGNPYGMNVSRMDSHGGWLANPLDLARLIARLEGGILKPETVSAMTAPSAVNPGYARGWFLTGRNRWHTGGLPGTSAVIVVTPSGFCWAALANSRGSGSMSVQQLDRTVWRMIQQVKSWTTALADHTRQDH
jgi:CubicO group peptidase (beta-lactamase class C family)